MTVQNTENEAYREYRVNRLRAFGGIHVGIGVLSAILGIAEIIIDSIILSKDCHIDYNGTDYYDKQCDDDSLRAESFIFYDILCFLFSGWFILTGYFLFGMTKRRQSSWRYLPCRPALQCLGIIEWVIAIAAASFCCCCTPWENTDISLLTRTPICKKRSLVYITCGQHTNIVGMPITQIIQSGPGQDGFAMRNGIYPAGEMTQQFQVSKPHFARAEPGQQVNRQPLPPYKI